MFVGLSKEQKKERETRKEQAQRIVGRLLSSFSVIELAKKIGVSYLTVYLWKNGKFAPQEANFDQLRRLDKTIKRNAEWSKKA